MHTVEMKNGADALDEVANILEQLGLRFPAVFDELKIRHPLCDELGGFAGMFREHAQSTEQEAATQVTPELLKAFDCLIPHVLHYASMPHAHPDAAKDAANARAVIAKAIGFNEEKKPSVSHVYEAGDKVFVTSEQKLATVLDVYGDGANGSYGDIRLDLCGNTGIDVIEPYDPVKHAQFDHTFTPIKAEWKKWYGITKEVPVRDEAEDPAA